jgi:hypothetical protein
MADMMISITIDAKRTPIMRVIGLLKVVNSPEVVDAIELVKPAGNSIVCACAMFVVNILQPARNGWV